MMQLDKRKVKLSKLLHSWREFDELFLYRKMLDESRKPFGACTSGMVNVSMTTKVVRRLLKLPHKLIDVVAVGMLFYRCWRAPKNRIVNFNHAARKRKTSLGNKPLYLSCDNFNLKDQIVFDDQDSNYKYPTGCIALNFQPLYSCLNIIIIIWDIYFRIVYRKSYKDILSFILKRYVWSVIFKLLQPYRVQILVWYGKEPIISVCKETRINVRDMQHGIIYEDHPIYNLHDALESTSRKYLCPDMCMVYGRFWKEQLLKCGWSERSIGIVGYFPDINPGFDKIQLAPYVLYTSQPHSVGVISSHIKAIENELKHRGWLAVIALHPSEHADDYIGVSPEVVRVTPFDSYDLLRCCVTHVSYSSTLLWEAMLFGKSSYVLKYGTETVDLLAELIKSGYGKPLASEEFPEPFTLPKKPPQDDFFSKINMRLLND